MEPSLKEEDLVIWKSPIQTLKYSLFEGIHYVKQTIQWIRSHYFRVVLSLLIVGLVVLSRQFEGPHQPFLIKFEKELRWCGWWVLLGVLSSIGLGTGLHTFVLYLGPHIASVTLAAHMCGSTNFPEPPYPSDIVCPEGETGPGVTMLDIMAKVRVESFMWGAGTALGELPPYFVARASRLSGKQDMDTDGESSKWADAIKKLVEKAGFIGILLCASIPNPLFDLAGITCGHFLVPFWTFFGATLIGKAIIKMSLQQIFVIAAFNESYFNAFLTLIQSVPYVGDMLYQPLKNFLVSQKESLKGGSHDKPQNWLSWLFGKFVLLMVLYFLVSIINSTAKNNFNRSAGKKVKRGRKKRTD